MGNPGTLLVGVAGGTASGKTTITRRLAERWPELLLIAHDRYYHTVADPSRHNYDHPDALDSALLCQHLDRLMAGQPAQLPVYDYASHTRQAHTEQVEPAAVVLVEGILVLADPQLARRFHLRVFVHADDDLRLLRRIRRDAVERARSVDSVLNQYEHTVRPMHQRFVGPSRALADLVLAGEGDMEGQVARLRGAIWERVGG